MVHYPIDFPADAAQTIVTSWRAGTITSQAPALVEAAWNLAGYAMKETLGESQPEVVPKATNSPMMAQSAGGKLPMAQSGGGCIVGCDSNGAPIDDEAMIAGLEQFCNCGHEQKLGFTLPFTTQQLMSWALSLALKILQGAVA